MCLLPDDPDLLCVAPGSRQERFVSLGEDDAVRLPLLAIRGRGPGTKLLVVGGQHGDECYGMLGVIHALSDLDPSKLCGEILAVPCLNVLGYGCGHRVNSYDFQDMNRVHPGKAEGTITERVVSFLHTHLLPRVDVVIDMHGGSSALGDLAFGRWTKGHAALDYGVSIEGLTDALGVDFVVEEPGDIEAPPGRLSSNPALFRLGLISIEAGAATASTGTNVARMAGFVRKALIHLGMVEGSLETRRTPRLARIAVQRAHVAGLFSASVDLSERVTRGTEVGVIRNLLGRIVQDVVANDEGVVLVLHTGVRVVPGHFLVGIGVAAE